MRKFLITILAVIALAATMSILWLFKGRELSIFIDDRFGTTEVISIPINSVTYQGNGTGGVLVINDLAFSLTLPDPNIASPHVGTSKDDQLALSFGGKVFPFGPAQAKEGGEESLMTSPAAGDEATMKIRRSSVCWIEAVKFQGGSPKQHAYYQLVWKKASGAILEMVWRYKQQCRPNIGWRDGFTSPEQSPSLIKIDIRP